jgi:hypothetical protein
MAPHRPNEGQANDSQQYHRKPFHNFLLGPLGGPAKELVKNFRRLGDFSNFLKNHLNV